MAGRLDAAADIVAAEVEMAGVASDAGRLAGDAADKTAVDDEVDTAAAAVVNAVDTAAADVAERGVERVEARP